MLKQLHRTDARVGDAVRQVVGLVSAADQITRYTTDLGSMFMVGGASLELRRLGRRDMSVQVLVAGTLGWAVAQQAKRSFDRRRPYEAEQTRRLISEPTGSSMPSGHAAVVSAVATVMASRSRAGRRWPWAVMAGWVPMTRVYLGVHYPSDTAAGLMLGHVLGRVVAHAVTERWTSRLTR